MQIGYWEHSASRNQQNNTAVQTAASMKNCLKIAFTYAAVLKLTLILSFPLFSPPEG